MVGTQVSEPRPSKLVTRAADSRFIDTVCCSFIHSSIHPSIHSFTRSSIQFIYSFVHSFIHPCVRPSVHSFIQFIHSSIQFIHSFIHSFIRASVRPFIHSFIHSYSFRRHTDKVYWPYPHYGHQHWQTTKATEGAKSPTNKSTQLSKVVCETAARLTSADVVY